MRQMIRLIVPSPSGVASPDCDCAPAVLERSISYPFFPSHLTVSDTYPLPLLSRWHGMYNPGGAIPLALLNRPAYELWSRFQSPQSLDALDLDEESRQAVLEMLEAGLLRPQSFSTRSPVTDHYSPTLSSWLHLTDRCNLRCAYCYLPHKREDMSLETGRAALEATFRSAVRHGYGGVKLKYAGGEPLLRFDLIQELHPYAQRLAEEHNLELQGVVLSNGTLLTPSLISTLQSLNLQLMISLDGVGKAHDSQRPYAGGRGSFEDVAEAIDLALAGGLRPHISITVSGRNAESLPETVAWLLERGVTFSINFYRENAFSAQHADLRLEEEKIITGMLAAFRVIEANLPDWSLLAALTDRANLAVPHTHTCSVGRDYLVFNQHGGVAKCQMKTSEAVGDVQDDDPLSLVRADLTGVRNPHVDEKEGCRNCEWKYWCAGGCPLQTYRATGRYDVKSPNCNIYRAIFPEVLRLEGLRLLKYAGELA